MRQLALEQVQQLGSTPRIERKPPAATLCAVDDPFEVARVTSKLQSTVRQDLCEIHWFSAGRVALCKSANLAYAISGHQDEVANGGTV